MSERLSKENINNKVIKEIEILSNQNVFSCYQCGKCSASCPLYFAMDLFPNQIIRLLQLGCEQEVAYSKTLLLCATCFICEARCPKGINLSALMDAIRIILQKHGYDLIKLSDIDTELIRELPQQALVGGLKKFTG